MLNCLKFHHIIHDTTTYRMSVFNDLFFFLYKCTNKYPALAKNDILGSELIRPYML